MSKQLKFSLGEETSRGSLTTGTVALDEGTVYFAHNTNSSNDGYSGADARLYIDVKINNSLTRIPVNSLYSIQSKSDVKGNDFLTGYVKFSSSTPSLTNSYNLVFTNNNGDTHTVNLVDKYIRALEWVNGTAAGPTANIYTATSGTNDTAIAFTTSAIPSASSSVSGIVTTGTQTFAGTKTFNKGLIVSGRTEEGAHSRDDEGIVVEKSNNNYAGVILGSPSGVRSVFYLTSADEAIWRYAYNKIENGNTTLVIDNIAHPKKSGTIALTSDVSAVTTALNNFATNANKTYYASGVNNNNNSFTLSTPTAKAKGGQTFSWTANNYYPISVSWNIDPSSATSYIGTMTMANNGTTKGDIAVTIPMPPEASELSHGIVSYGTQTFAGLKNFHNGLMVQDNVTISYNSDYESLDFTFN